MTLRGLALVVTVATIATACSGGSPVPEAAQPVDPRPSGSPTESPAPAGFDPYPAPVLADSELVAAARRRIEHVVFLVKENRTFDHMFGRFPGADGATTGHLCDGSTVPLRPAPDTGPDLQHSFLGGLLAIDG